MTEILYPRKTLMLLVWDSALFPLERFLSGSKSGTIKREKKPQSRKIELPWCSCSVLQTEGIFQRRPPTSTGTSPRPCLSTAAYYLLNLTCPWRWKVSLAFLQRGLPSSSNAAGGWVLCSCRCQWWTPSLTPRSHRNHPWKTAPHPWLWDFQDQVLSPREDYRQGRGSCVSETVLSLYYLSEINLLLNNCSFILGYCIVLLCL